jgi:hypothetical protein
MPLQVEMLQYLSTVAKGTAQRFAVLNALVSALFDLNPSSLTHLKVQLSTMVANGGAGVGRADARLKGESEGGIRHCGVIQTNHHMQPV